MNKQVKRNKEGLIISRGIEWVGEPGLDNGYTSNPVGGCHFGCRWTMPDGTVVFCYAERVASGLAGAAYPAGFAPVEGKKREVYWRPQEIAAWKRHTEPCEIFVGSQSDVFGPWVPEVYVQAILEGMRACSQHRFYTLTKNPARLLKYDFPANVWVGASVPATTMVSHAVPQAKVLAWTLNVLGNVRARVKWLSIEPLSFDVAPVLKTAWEKPAGGTKKIDWAVIGAASNGRRTCQPVRAWVENLLALFDQHGIKVFFKGNLDWPESAWRESKPEG